MRTCTDENKNREVRVVCTYGTYQFVALLVSPFSNFAERCAADLAQILGGAATLLWVATTLCSYFFLSRHAAVWSFAGTLCVTHSGGF